MRPGKDAGTRNDLQKKGPDPHPLCREDVEEVVCGERLVGLHGGGATVREASSMEAWKTQAPWQLLLCLA